MIKQINPSIHFLHLFFFGLAFKTTKEFIISQPSNYMKGFYKILLPLLLLVCSSSRGVAQTVTVTSDKVGVTLKAAEVITYTVVVANNTSAKILGVSISDPIPTPNTSFTLVPNSLQVGGTSLTCTVPSTITNTIAISGFDLLPDETITYKFKMRIVDPYPTGGAATIAHTVTVNPSANTASISNNINGAPSLTVVKTASTLNGGTNVNKSGLIDYTINITNSASAGGSAQNVVFADVLDTDTEIFLSNNISVALTYTGTYSVTSGNTIGNTSVGVTVGNIPPGGVATIKFTVKVKSSVAICANCVTNTATITGGNFTGSISSNTSTLTVVYPSCAVPNTYYVSSAAGSGSEANNPNKPYTTLSSVVTAINADGAAAGGTFGAKIKFLDSYYNQAAFGTMVQLNVPCVTIDGNGALCERTGGQSGLIWLGDNADNFTLKNVTISKFNMSPAPIAFNGSAATGSSRLTGVVLDNVKVIGTQTVNALDMTYTDVTMINCQFSNNTPGGAIDMLAPCTMVATNCDFFCNQRSDYGGAISTNGSSNDNTNRITITGGSFKNNSSSGDGGAIYCNWGGLTVNGTTFTSNTTTGSGGASTGGAVYVSNSPAGFTHSFTNCVFNHNTATNGASGLQVRAAYTITGCQFVSNTSKPALVTNISTTITNSYFANNTGNGISGTVSLSQCTVTGNTGTGVTGITNLTNSIVCSNTINTTVPTGTITNSAYNATTCAAVPSGAGVTFTPGTFSAYTNASCPATPTGTAFACPSKFEIGSVAINGCRFQNFYTGNFANATPTTLDAKAMTLLTPGFTQTRAVTANYYEYRFVITNSAGTIIEIKAPTSNDAPTNTSYTPTAASFNGLAAGTYRVYGYYYHPTLGTTPTTGTNISTYPGSGCGAITPTYATFEILKPVVLTVGTACTGNAFTCQTRYTASVTATGGYPEYADANSIKNQYYDLSADATYVSPTFAEDLTGILTYNTPESYMYAYTTGNNFAAKVSSDLSCNNSTTLNSSNSPVIAVPTVCTQTISGTVYSDSDGGDIDGTPVGSVNSTQLYVYLVSTTSTPSILAKVAVNNTTGAYSFASGFAPNSSYKVVLTTVSTGVVGSTVIPSVSLPGSWYNSAEGVAAAGDGTANGIISPATVTDLGTNISTANFALGRAPQAVDNSAIYTQGNPITVTVLSNDIPGGAALDPTRVSLTTPVGATGVTTDAAGDVTGFTVAGEGAWAVNAASGTITFTPESGFTSNPTPITYTVTDATNHISNTATVTLQAAPLALANTTIYTQGATVTVSILTNDQPGGAALDPTRVSLTTPVGATGVTTDAAGDVTGFTVAGEGVWAVNGTTGVLTFTPESGFTSNPTPITYTVRDNASIISNTATVTLQAAPLALANTTIYTQGATVTLSILTNDQPGGAALDPTRVSLTTPVGATGVTTDAAGDVTGFTVAGEGVWAVNGATGVLTFTPQSGFTSNPTPITYTVRDNASIISNTATVTLQAAPLALANTSVYDQEAAISLSILTNDQPGGAALDPTRVSLTTPVGATGVTTDAAGDVTGFTVAGEGVWAVNGATGVLTFTPESGFTSNPTPITYTVRDNAGIISNTATVTLQAKPLALDNTVVGTSGESTTIDILANDKQGGAPLNPASVLFSNNTTTFAVAGEGTWTVNTSNGRLTFTPISGFLTAPSPVSYTVANMDGNRSNAAIVTITITLPVNLLYFKGHSVSCKQNILEWATATEKNNAYFELEYSTDGLNFTTLRTIRGQGTTNNTEFYNVVDVNVKGKTYYRLRQVDFDGTNVIAGKTIAIEDACTIGSNTVICYPSPVTELLTYHIAANKAQTVRVKIVDAIGQEVYTDKIYIQDGGNTLTANTNLLAAGMYFLTITYENNTMITRKFIKE